MSKTVLITGGNRGIGIGLVKEYLKRQDFSFVFVTARENSNKAPLGYLKCSKLIVLDMDVCDDASIRAAAQAVAEKTGGKLDVVINNSGVLNNYELSAEPDQDSLIEQFEVNTVGPVLVTQATNIPCAFQLHFQRFLKLLLKSGTPEKPSLVVNISSSLASITLCEGSTPRNYTPYRMSKAALNMFTRSLAIDFREENIVIVSMAPGWVRTAMGTSAAELSIEESTSAMMNSFDKIKKEHSGRCFDRHLMDVPL